MGIPLSIGNTMPLNANPSDIKDGLIYSREAAEIIGKSFEVGMSKFGREFGRQSEIIITISTTICGLMALYGLRSYIECELKFQENSHEFIKEENAIKRDFYLSLKRND